MLEGLITEEEELEIRYLEIGRKVVVICLAFLMLIKTFFFMRLFRSMAHLVAMMQQVFIDLQAFLLFFFILLWITSLILSTLQLGNYEGARSANLRAKAQAASYPGIEYQHLPRWLKPIFAVVRIALGDFDYAESVDLPAFENLLYWATWLILVVLTCIIFLNFIIAEVGASYGAVKCKVGGLIEQDRAQLINEADDMLLAK